MGQCPVQRGWFEWGPGEKKKQQKKKQQIKKNGTAKYSESIGGETFVSLFLFFRTMHV